MSREISAICRFITGMENNKRDKKRANLAC